MSTHPTHTASIPNPALEPFRVLAGNWDTSGTHPLVPGTVVHGRSTFEWLENGAFLLRRSSVDDPQFPNGLSIIGSDDSAQQFFMLYFDERGVSRKYEVTLRDGVWKMWREAPGFSQRFTGTITDNGHTIQCQWELSRDDATWQNDLALTFTRAVG